MAIDFSSVLVVVPIMWLLLGLFVFFFFNILNGHVSVAEFLFLNK